MDDLQDSSSSPFKTYHCLCSNLVLATAHTLESLPRRNEPVQDNALILPPATSISVSSDIETEDALSQSTPSALLNVLPDRRPIVVQREDGFEKRILLRCGRCRLVLGYAMTALQGSSPVYLLPGSLVETSEMSKGTRPEVPAWAEQTT
ncbi:hypothetical protein LTR84_012525 [Exophiala bonariae]|uniref:STEEP1 domain-containing protein n=1 Tax=Exophiala bonariae TaxID=1690606 RepID=A0AAV9NE98_9EURO|nr:hypothetical protein LTR84_012525 [Exophiala bonariae]